MKKDTDGYVTAEACIGVAVLISLISLFLFLTGYLEAIYFLREQTNQKVREISLQEYATGILFLFPGPVVTQEEKARYRIGEAVTMLQPGSSNLVLMTSFTYEGLWGRVEGRVSASVSRWAGDGVVTGTNVWDLPPMERGVEIQRRFGGNLPKYFPVLDIFDSATGTATVIVSMDTTLPSYLDGRGMVRLLRPLMEKFHSFQRGDRDGTIITREDISRKIVVLVIPENPLEPVQLDALKEMSEAARIMGMEFRVQRFQKSRAARESF